MLAFCGIVTLFHSRCTARLLHHPLLTRALHVAAVSQPTHPASRPVGQGAAGLLWIKLREEATQNGCSATAFAVPTWKNTGCVLKNATAWTYTLAFTRQCALRLSAKCNAMCGGQPYCS
eukprot:365375-Chlamydomonas_euryale.AAC.9